MRKKIIIDHNKCTGCFICGETCSLIKTGRINPAGSRIRVIDWEDTGVTVPILCQHCEEPVCLPACPEGAISKDPDTGIVSIDPDRCVSCTVCRNVCPYAGPAYSAPEKRVVLCDQCGGEPSCVIVCPTGALSYEEHQESDQAKRLQSIRAVRENILKKEHRS